ncbi:MAG: alpha/beta hydrolase [Halobacteriaceae archaeon]
MFPLPGPREAVADLDDADGAACVVACPPHPRHGGHRGDRRLRAVADACADRGVACLRFDYGPWDGGRGEAADALAAVRWAGDRFDAVGLFGYSFGGSVAALAAGAADPGAVAACSLLAPAAAVAADRDPVAAVRRVDGPVQVIVGARDDTVDAAPVAAAVKARGGAVTELPADHHFVGQHEAVGERVARFLASRLP